MNARLYDPFRTRFLSADTMIPDPNIAHSYNRYIYVYDNPLKYTDPSGHWVMFVIGAIIYTIGATSDDPDIQKAGMLIGAVMMGGSLNGHQFSAAQSGAMVGFFSGTVNSGGDVGEGVKQGVISGASAYAVNEIAHGGVNGGSEYSGLEQAGLQGLVGGLTAELRGGKFKDGFAAAVVAKGIDASEILKDVDPTLQGLGTAIAGGLAAKAGGGSFEDGAMSALFVFLYNARGKIGASIKAPDWLQELFGVDIKVQGVSGGIVIQHPWSDGDDWGIDIYGDISIGGENYGIGKASVDIGWSAGNINDLNNNGVTTEFGGHYGLIGISLSTDVMDNINGFSFHFGPGYNLYGSGNIGRTLFQ